MEFPKIKVGVVQATPVFFDLTASIEKVVAWIEKGKQAGCQLLLFPESFLPGYPRGLRFDAVVGRRTDAGRATWLDYWANSVDVKSSILDPIKTAIQQAGIFVALGVTEREAVGGSLYCSLLYFGPDGTLLGVHRKLKPTGLERYVWAEGDGSTLHAYDTSQGRIGGLICWENYMPLARMAMYQKGVEIYLAPTADARPTWQGTLQHIALEGRCFVLGCNQYIRKGDYPERYQEEIKAEADIMSAGGSVIVAPTGEVLAGPLWNEEGLLTAQLDFSLLAKSKLDFDVTGHYARPDVFRFETVGQPETVRVSD